MKTVRNKKIWIIGASSGIGEALAKELSDQGASLILSARREQQLTELNKTLDDQHQILPVDASDHTALETAAKTLETLDSVIFLAAIYSAHSKETKDIQFIHQMVNVNLNGAFNTVHAVRPIFENQGYGQIVLCGSVAGYRGLPFGQPYCATKAAIINYAESLKIECEDQNIDVKVINPGFVKTPLTDKNDFPMPMMIDSDKAARAITRDIQSSRFEIHFPKRFTLIMKLLHLLPNWLYFSIARKMMPKI